MKTIAVIAYDKSSVQVYADQVNYFMGNRAKTILYSVKDNFISQIMPADLYLISTCAYTELNNIRKYLPLKGEVVIIRVTIRKNSLKQLLKVPPRTKALLVNISHKMAIETMALLNQLGVDNIDFYPCSPNEEYSQSIKFAVTPGESRYVPEGITDILDIGPRILSSETIVEMMLKLHSEELMEEDRLKEYFQDLVDDNYNFNRIFQRSVQMEGLIDILQSTLNIGIICMDGDSVIFFFNKKAEEILNLTKQRVFDKKAGDVLPFIPFEECFSTRREIKERMLKVQNVDISLSIVPVVRGYDFIGAMATIQRFSDEEFRQHKLRCQLMNKGHAAKYTFDSIAGTSPAISRAKEIAAKMAKRPAPVLLTGESGTGKELFAHAIHAASDRSEYPFVAINCAAIPDNLMESELFGYEEGAFTGAKKGGKMGYFEFAHKGTLFLDEIEGMSTALQLKLLRVIQEKEVLRVGGNRVINVNVRIIAATNENLEVLVQKGEFRKDLYYRLNVLSIELPPLRERGRDVLQLVHKFRQETESTFVLSSETEEILLNQTWDGNIRQLRNCLEYFACLDKTVINPEDLPPSLYTKKDSSAILQTPDKNFRQYSAESAAAKEQSESPCFFQDTDALQEFLLREMAARAKDGKSCGRRYLIQKIRGCGYLITERELRGQLKDMEEKGLIDISQGRGGSKITKNGVMWLNMRIKSS